jgi:formylglycine-generating enzyme required for sulfatase activity
MNGNVWEWCQDWAGRYPEGEVTDPTGGPPGIEKMLRGGHFGLELHFCRSAMRGDLSTEHRFEFLGFRVLLEEADPGS